MSNGGWVIFPNRETFEIMHARGKAALGIPIISRSNARGGRLDSRKQQTTGIASVYPKVQGTIDDTVAVYIERRWWPREDLSRLTFLRIEQVSDYFEPLEV